MKSITLIGAAVIIFCSVHFSVAQNRNMVWCFGDSSGINFNTGLPVTIATGIDSRGSSVSISDTTGSLLFYAGGSPDPVFGGSSKSVKVRDTLHQIMPNGDSLVGFEWYRELVITDMPDSMNKYYLFSIGVTPVYGFYYSVIDMNQNGGLGAVIQKNIQLETFKVVDCMQAIKHGNGRDWWIIIRNAANYGNEHYLYLVSPTGVSPAIIQPVGSVNNTNAGRYAFSHDGSKLAFVNYIGLMEIYDFNRCTGIISNPLTIHPEPTSAPYHHFTFCEFSPNNRFLYVTAYDDTCYLYQYDLLSPTPATTRITLDTITNDLIGIGSLKLAPDGKIYLTHAWECTAFPFCYPYPDSVYNTVNMNLSVINYPDSLGTACGYAPFSFYLGGKRTYYGLPNNPDYDMPAWAGSPCDTILSTSPNPSSGEGAPTLMLTYVTEWQKLFVNAQHLKGKNAVLEVFDVTGKVIYSSAGLHSPLGVGGSNGYFTQDITCTAFAKGMYLVRLTTEKEKLVKKFVRE